MAFTILNPCTPRPIRGVLFDMDGVILDTEKLYARFWMEAARSLGYPMTYTQALGMRSLNHAAGQAQLNRYFGTQVPYDTVRNTRIRLMDAFIRENGVEPKPGIRELLDALEAANIPAAVTSASPRDRIREHLGSLGLYDRFRAVCTAYEVAHGKPEPDIYQFGAASLGLHPADCIALEDSYTGILSAVRAGCRAVIVPDLDEPDERICSTAWARADSLLDVAELVK